MTMWRYDNSSFYISLESAQNLRKAPSRVTSMYIKLHDDARARQTKQEIMRVLKPYGSFDVSTWREKRQAFIRLIDMERKLTGVILFSFLLVAGFSIAAIMTNIVMSKRLDIGILRAIGGARRGVMAIFLTYGLLIGIIGATIGVGVGVIFLEKLDTIEQFVYYFTGLTPYPRRDILDDEFYERYGSFLAGIDRITSKVTGFSFASIHDGPQPDVYYLKSIPREMNYSRIFAIALLGVFMSFISSAYPSYRAASVEPVRAIREGM